MPGLQNPTREGVEMLAKMLHESGREAVERRLVYRDDVPIKPFAEWDDLHENAREGRRVMARFLVRHALYLREILVLCDVTDPVIFGDKRVGDKRA